MMRVGDLPFDTLCGLLNGAGLALRNGPFVVHVRSPFRRVARQFHTLYAHHTVETEAEFCDFHVSVAPPRGIRRWARPQALFYFDDRCPFKPLPEAQSFAMLEWGLNWCVANHAHQYLVVHAAAVAKDGEAAILCGPPGSGKSTLCAALISAGWQLLSDELALVDPETLRLSPLARPIGLKNASIDAICAYDRETVLGEVVADTAKGTLSHVRPPEASVAAAHAQAMPRWLITPRFDSKAQSGLTGEPEERAFMHLAQNAFNYSVLGELGFATVGALVDRCEGYRLTYGGLDDAVARVERLRERSLAAVV